jgi:hypothetical protein
MDFLNKIYNRPSNKKALMILVAGLSQKDVAVPNRSKKSRKKSPLSSGGRPFSINNWI